MRAKRIQSAKGLMDFLVRYANKKKDSFTRALCVAQ